MSFALKRLAVIAVLVAALVPVAGFGMTDGKYLSPVGGEYTTRALLSAGDTVPETSNPALTYQMVGIPDGLGAYERRHDKTVLYMNHEFGQTVQSEPTLGQPLNRGAIVSQFILDEDGEVVSGQRAYDTVYAENTLVGPAAEVGNATPGFSRFCSASLAGREYGFDRPIYFTNEESSGAGTFDGKGGQTVAIFDNEAHTLPRLGHFAKENTVVMPGTGRLTVIISLEDGPAGLDSQLYMYVGWKNYYSNNPLSRNGLDNGELYVFAGKDAAQNSELAVQSGSVQGKWVRIPGAAAMTDAQLETAADAAGAFGFVRIEDGAFNKKKDNLFYFVTTGGSAASGNTLGRLYELNLNKWSPIGGATLTVAYNADTVALGGGDIAFSPDNIDTSGKYLMIQEDGTAESRPVIQANGRDAGIWRFGLKGNGEVQVSSAEFVAELDSPGRDGIPVPVSGTWESSGIIDASEFFGRDTWLTTVQAHSPTTAQGTNAVEDGQLLIIEPTGHGHGHHDD